jgi:Na+-driven multidrug efflux pump
MSTAVTVTVIAFSYQMLQYWISVDVADKATTVLIVLAVTNFVLAIIIPLNNFLLGMGKLKAMSITSISTAIINATLLVFFLPIFGIVGAAWAYLFALVPYLFLIYKTEKHYLELPFRRAHYLKLISQLLTTSSIVFLIDVFFMKQLIINFFLVILASATSCVLFIGIHYVLGFFEKEDSRDILNFVKQAIRSPNNHLK